MSLDPAVLAAILLMAAITYATRVGGLLAMGRRRLSGRARAAFEALPPAVLAAVVAPAALATGWPETLASLAALLAATRLPLLGTIAVGMGVVALARGVSAGLH